MSSISTFGLGGDTLVPVLLSASTLTTPTVNQDLIDTTVPASAVWRIREVLVVCRAYSNFQILVNGVQVGSGKTSPVEANVRVNINPYVVALTTHTVKVKFTQSYGPVMDVEVYLYATVS